MVRQLIPVPLRRRLQRLVARASARMRGYGKINRFGRGVVNLIDIGAVGRLPSPWHQHAPLIRKLLRFEPREGRAQQPHVTSLDVAVWERDETRDFYICAGDGTGSSLLQQNIDYVREHYDALKARGPRHMAETWFERSALVRTTSIACRSLDSILAELGGDVRYHFLKVDVQGAEYQVLRGAERFLREDCLGLHLELFTIPLYRDMVLLPEVEAYLETLGFRLVKKMPPHGTFDSQHDCLFLKSAAPPSPQMDAIRRIYRVTQ